MKFTLSWLKTHLETDASVDTIAETLTDLGLEVEGVENPADALGAFTIARVIEAVQHPNADRLRLCRVETFPDGPGTTPVEVQVVCGAPNAQTGLVGVFAPVGTHIPGTGVDLKPGVIRGVESNGMLCSERELMLSEDHDGIIDLPKNAPLGVRYIDYADANDPVIEIAITPNRPDALGVAGIARDLAARGLGRKITPAIEPVAGTFPSPIDVALMPDVADSACPLFIGRMVRGVKNGPSPEWLQRWLRAVGLRPISALVDVTNFLTMDRARPLHVFDAGKVQGNIHVRLSRPGETLLALDGKEYAFDDSMTLICDDAGPEGIGGVMGGELTGCTEATTDVFIESAYFDPTRTAATGRKLRIASDARYRFERGIDPAFSEAGIEMATRLIMEICGGEASELVIAGAVPDTTRAYRLDPARVSSLVGMDISAATQVATLEALGFAVSAEGYGYTVSPPSWRPDVQGEADLVEEVARIASLSGLQSAPLPRPDTAAFRPVLTPMQRRVARTRRQLAAAGLNECVTYAFVSGEQAELFDGGQPVMALENPISSDLSHMRPSALPHLLAAAARNQARGVDTAALFEVGPGFHGAEPGEQTEQAAVLRCGTTAAREWTGAGRPVDALDARADAEAVLAACGVAPEKVQISRDVPAWLHPGRSGALKLGPKVTLALFGELHPKVMAAFDLRGPAVVALVTLDAIPQARAKGATRPALDASDLQAVDRDFAFVVSAETEAAAILRAVRGADRKHVVDATVFDVFDGQKAATQLGEGMKSVAVTVRLQPKAQTFTDEQIAGIGENIVAAVSKATGASLRT